MLLFPRLRTREAVWTAKCHRCIGHHRSLQLYPLSILDLVFADTHVQALIIVHILRCLSLTRHVGAE